jgi:hypothetical protein
MAERIRAARIRRESKKKQRVRLPEPKVTLPTPEVDVLPSAKEDFSPEQIIRLQRTIGNKAVGNLIRQKQAAAVQRESDTVELRTSDSMIQQWPWSSKKKETVPPPPATPPPASARPPSTPPPAFNPDAPRAEVSVAPTPTPAPSGGGGGGAGPVQPPVRGGGAPVVGPVGPVSVVPVSVDSNVRATEAEKANPVLALKTYREAVGVTLREAKRDQFKIARYKAFLEADFIFLKTNVPILLREEASLNSQVNANVTERDPAKKAKVKARLDAQHTKLTERKAKIKETDLPASVVKAETRLTNAHQANLIADNELPLVEHAYDSLVAMRHEGLEGVKHSKLFGSGNPQARIDVHRRGIQFAEAEAANILYSAKKRAGFREKATKLRIKIAKQQKRVEAINKARTDLAKGEVLRGQAKLSQDLMRVKRKGLKAAKQEVKATERNVQIETHLKEKIKSAGLNLAVSTVSLGIYEIEQNKVDGGYTSKREVVSMLDVWKRDWAALKNVWKARPYGKMTAMHLFLQGLGTLILKPLRKVFTAAALIFAGLSLIPGLAVVTGPLSAFCSLVTMGLIAAKVALDVVLATWSSLTLALNKNAHNTDTLRGQATGQAMDALAGSMSLGAVIGVPAISNLHSVGGSYVDPTQNLTQHGGDIMHFNPGTAGTGIGPMAQVLATKGTATLGMVLAEKGTGAALEMEALGPGARALFLTRQGEILRSGKPPAVVYEELREVKLMFLSREAVKNEEDIAKFTKKNNVEKLEKAKEKRLVINRNIARVQEQVRAARAAALDSRRMGQQPIAPQTPAVQRDSMADEMEKERLMRAASTMALAIRAKAQLQSLMGGVGESEAHGGEVAGGAQSAVTGVASAPSTAGVQEADAPNAASALDSVTSAKSVLAEIKEVLAEGPATVDEAMHPETAAP